MNGIDELPPDHFWDSEKAEKEYYEIERKIETVLKKQNNKRKLL